MSRIQNRLVEDIQDGPLVLDWGRGVHFARLRPRTAVLDARPLVLDVKNLPINYLSELVLSLLQIFVLNRMDLTLVFEIHLGI